MYAFIQPFLLLGYNGESVIDLPFTPEDYRHQDDENISSRGSISMKNCALRVAQGDKLRFEVHSTPSRSASHTSIQKWYLKVPSFFFPCVQDTNTPLTRQRQHILWKPPAG